MRSVRVENKPPVSCIKYRKKLLTRSYAVPPSWSWKPQPELLIQASALREGVKFSGYLGVNTPLASNGSLEMLGNFLRVQLE